MSSASRSCHVASASADTEGLGITEGDTGGYHGQINGQYKDHGPLRARRDGSYGPCPRSGGTRAPVSAQPLTSSPVMAMVLRSGLDHGGSVFAPCLLGFSVPRGISRPRTVFRLGVLRISRQRATANMLVECSNRTPEQRTLNLQAHRSSCRVPCRNQMTITCAWVQGLP